MTTRTYVCRRSRHLIGIKGSVGLESRVLSVCFSSMDFRILLFAAARDACQGQSHVDVRIVEAEDKESKVVLLQTVLMQVVERYPGLETLLRQCLISVNLECYSLEETKRLPISPWDEVALIPPVSGG